MTPKTAPLEAGRWGPDPIRFVWLAAVVSVFVLDIGEWRTAFASGWDVTPLGGDLNLYREAATRWMSGGGFYSAFQLAGPYDVWNAPSSPVLYPPTSIPLFAAFTVLPAFLWWAIPLGIIAACVAYHRPRPLALALIGAMLLWPSTTYNALWSGNPSMWCAAALALATTGRSSAAPLMLIKPTLGPFALWGIRSRSWWIGLAGFAVVSLAFLPLWRDYLTALGNASVGWSYQLWHLPLVLVPVVAWLGRTRTAASPAGSGSGLSRRPLSARAWVTRSPGTWRGSRCRPAGRCVPRD